MQVEERIRKKKFDSRMLERTGAKLGMKHTVFKGDVATCPSYSCTYDRCACTKPRKAPEREKKEA